MKAAADRCCMCGDAASSPVAGGQVVCEWCKGCYLGVVPHSGALPVAFGYVVPVATGEGFHAFEGSPFAGRPR